MVFVVAEIGVNWNGDFDLLSTMVKNSKKSGVNAIKFQAFNADMIKDHPQKELLLKTTVSKSNIERIDEICKSFNLEWFCTPMYPDAVEMLEPYVKKFKLRVHDGIPIVKNEESELLKKILNTGKEVIISSEKNPKDSIHYNNKKIKWLYCVPKYPCSLEDLNFEELDYFNGYSNHCNDVIAPLTAVILGIEIIEVHVTNDKNGSFVDNPVSFDFSELSYLVDLVRKVEKIKR